MTHLGTVPTALVLGVVILAGCDENGSQGEDGEMTCDARVEQLEQRIAAKKTDFEVPTSAAPWVNDKAKEIRAASQPSQRATLIAEGMSKSIHGCPELVDVFKTIATMPAGQKDAAFKREAPKAIASCDCEGVDVDAFETFARFSVAMEP